METLLELLTQYAEENLILHFLREYTPRMQAAQLRVDRLTRELEARNPESAELLEQLKTELACINDCREQAFLLSGLSIGLELGRL